MALAGVRESPLSFFLGFVFRVMDVRTFSTFSRVMDVRTFAVAGAPLPVRRKCGDLPCGLPVLFKKRRADIPEIY